MSRTFRFEIQRDHELYGIPSVVYSKVKSKKEEKPVFKLEIIKNEVRMVQI